MAGTPTLEVMSPRRRAVVGLLIGGCVLLLFQLLRGTQAFERPELALIDLRTTAFVGTREPDPRIALAMVQEEDLRRMSEARGFNVEWPWEGKYQAMAVEFVREAGAAVLLCDFLYFDVGRGLDEVSEEVLKVERETLENAIADRRLLGEALTRFGATAVGVFPVDRPQLQLPGREAFADDRSLGSSEALRAPAGTLLRAGVDLPVAVMFEHADYGGFVNAYTGVDGIVRSAYPVMGGGRWMWPSLAMAGASLLTKEPVHVSEEGVRLGEIPVPHDDDGRFLINFRGPANSTYPVFDVYDLMMGGYRLASGKPPSEYDLELKEELEGKILVWGASYVPELDVLPTPLSGGQLGPELHATQIDNLLHGDARVRVGRWLNFALLAACCLGLGILGAYTRKRFLPNLVAISVVGVVIGGGFLLFRAGWSIDLFTPVLACITTSFASTTFRLLTEGRRNKWLESTFGRYLSPDVIKALKDDPSRLALGGRRREITIFFSDVAGFTSISERLKPEQVVLLLNRYLTDQSQELMDQKGLIDKFEGDAIMAFFGDPFELPDHAVKACRAAVRCRKALPHLEPVWRELGLDSFEMRIGLNSGTALVGNMGSEKRFDYTCMGDAVNLASRLEGANKAFGSKILIGPMTYAEAADRILAKRLADVVVMGKQEAVPVYELVAMADDATDAERVHVEAFNRAGDAVRTGDQKAAREALDAADAAMPGDGPVAWLRRVLGELESGAREGPWDGRLVLDRK